MRMYIFLLHETFAKAFNSQSLHAFVTFLLQQLAKNYVKLSLRIMHFQLAYVTLKRNIIFHYMFVFNNINEHNFFFHSFRYHCAFFLTVY